MNTKENKKVDKKQVHPLLKFAAAVIFFILFVLFHTLLIKLVFGWLLFLRRVVPQVEINTEILFQAITAIVLLLVGGHTLLKWIYEHRTHKKWRKKWTVGVVTTTILLFVGGTASVGIMTFGEATAEHGITSGHISHRYDHRLRSFDAMKMFDDPQKQYMDIIYNDLRKFSLDANNIQNNFFRSFHESFQYVCVVSKDHSLGAVIRAPIENDNVEVYRTLVIFWQKGQLRQQKLYKHMPLDKLIASIENGIIPPGSLY